MLSHYESIDIGFIRSPMKIRTFITVSEQIFDSSNYESINLGCTSFLLPLGCSGLTILSRHPITEVRIVLMMVDVVAMMMMTMVVVVVMMMMTMVVVVVMMMMTMVVVVVMMMTMLINNSGATGPVHPPRQLLEIRRRNICPERGRFFSSFAY